ncbi:MAG: hypothetical protein LUE11_06050 [Clostridia bacterium]|nr:hypothetical protein [Clostridia bacterium]
MAERRMFARSVVNSDTFLDMPATTRALYFHLGMEADDDGFLNNPKGLVRYFGSAQDDLKMLISKGFLIPFQSGVIVIRHWKQSNYIQKDRYRPTKCKEEMKMLSLTDNVYTLDTECIQDISRPDTQDRLGKDRLELGKDRLYNNAPTSDKSEPEPEATEPVFIELILNTGQMYPVTQKQVDGWKQLYPGVDIEQALRSMAGWLEGNPTKRKTARGIVRFITGWLDRDQNSGRNQRKEVEDNGKSDYYARIFSDPEHNL